ncbi:hypothetical protein KY337_02300 [Candidatus Woesearchaeota archaeon]|nr:hypothetical protein [Candidatus Woesearchaeota archaeon]
MRKVTYYRMGHAWVGYKALMERLGCEAVTPPAITNKTIELGVKNSPDSACFPYKIFLGNFIEIMEKADTLSMLPVHSILNCRLCDYHLGIIDALKKQGFEFEYIPITGLSAKNILENFSKLAGRSVGYKEGAQLIFHYIRKIAACDWLERLCTETRPYEINKGDCTKLYEQGLKIIDECNNVKKAKNRILKLHKEIRIDKSRKVKRIGFVGDVFALIDAFYNQNIIEKLGNMGVIVDKALYLGEALRNPYPFAGPYGKRSFEYIYKLSEPYISALIGGYTNHTIGMAVWYAKNKFDGIIQMYAFGCVPEIVGKVALQKISKDFNIPVMHLVRDEHSSETGFQTRLEAFVDLLH